MSLYTPLNSARREIRLVSFSGEALGNIECELRIASLHAAPDYSALSYLWGEPVRSRSIFVNNVLVAITETLFEALRALRNQYAHEAFWIDALCIDQENSNEKASQIPLMGEIYSKSRQTVAWLGSAKDDSDAAFHLLQRWQIRQTSPILSVGCTPYNYHREYLDNSNTLPRRHTALLIPAPIPEEKPIPSWTECVVPSDRDDQSDMQQYQWSMHILASVLQNEAAESSLKALQQLLKRPYWTRVWIKQEFALPSKLVIGCGSIFMDGEEFRQASQAVVTVHKYAAVEECGQTWGESLAQFPILEALLIIIKPLWGLRASYSKPGQGALSLWTLVNLTVLANTTLEADRLFGILGLVRSSDFEIEITYEKPAEVIFFDLTVNFIFLSAVQFDCLCITGQGLRRRTKSITVSNTLAPRPTWLPTYTSEGQYYAGQEFPVTWSCPKLPTECLASTDRQKLRTPGIIFDRITQRSPGASDSDASPGFYVYHNEWFRLAMTYRKAHPSGLPLLQVFFRTLFRDNYTGTAPYTFRNSHCERLFFKLVTGFMAYVCHLRMPNVLSGERGIITQVEERLSPEELNEFRSLDCPSWFRPFVAWLTLPPFELRKFEMSKILEPFCGRTGDGPVLTIPSQVLKSDVRNPGVSRFLGKLIEEEIHHGGCFFVTERGYMGVGPPGLAVEDELCFMPGATMPLAIRHARNPGEMEEFHDSAHYSLIGACYVYGVMHGQVATWPGVEDMKRVFVLV